MKMHDLRKSGEEMAMEGLTFLGPRNEYPCGTTISLDEKTLAKIEIDHSDWQVGDIFEITGMWRITAVSENESDEGKRKCVTLQALMLGAEEEPDAEDEE